MDTIHIFARIREVKTKLNMLDVVLEDYDNNTTDEKLVREAEEVLVDSAMLLLDAAKLARVE